MNQEISQVKRRPLYIFDIDGTLADCRHRLHYIDKANGSQDWELFYRACTQDKPILPVIETMNSLLYAGAEIWFFTGRSDIVESQTVQWLERFTKLRFKNRFASNLMMREQGDRRPDHEMKKELYEMMFHEDRERLVGVFEDRKRVVDMWRSLGVTCFQVSSGEF